MGQLVSVDDHFSLHSLMNKQNVLESFHQLLIQRYFVHLNFFQVIYRKYINFFSEDYMDVYMYLKPH